MVKPGDILGLNARVQRYTSLNSRKAKRLGFSKLRAKAFLSKHNIGVPQLYAQITSQEELREFNWHSIEGHFAVKPASGSAGKGIIVISHKVGHDRWVDVSGKEYSSDDLTLHVSDILDGQYSTWGNRHKALVEERIPIHPDLEDYVMQAHPTFVLFCIAKSPSWPWHVFQRKPQMVAQIWTKAPSVSVLIWVLASQPLPSLERKKALPISPITTPRCAVSRFRIGWKCSKPPSGQRTPAAWCTWVSISFSILKKAR